MKEISEAEFDGVTSTGTVLIEFGAEWCGPCKAMLPVLRRLSTEYTGKMDVYSVDIDHSPAIAAKHGVMSVPTVVLYKGGKVVERMVGGLSERDLKKKIEPHIG